MDNILARCPVLFSAVGPTDSPVQILVDKQTAGMISLLCVQQFFHICLATKKLIQISQKAMVQTISNAG